MTAELTKAPTASPGTFLNLPLELNLDNINADVAILGVPYGKPYTVEEMANDQSRAPDALRRASGHAFAYQITDRYDWDFGGTLTSDGKVKIVDCGNVTADKADHQEHYRRAEIAARKIFSSGATLVALGGDHGIPIPIMRGLNQVANDVTLVHVDAHMDWRHESYGEQEGFRSPIRRASEMNWINKIVQIGIRGSGSLKKAEIDEARCYGSDIITAYEMHDMGMQAVLDRIPDGGPYYLSIDADGLDPTIMPAVMHRAPGGLDWIQVHKLIHGLTRKGRVLGMDLVEITPSHDIDNMTMIYAERLISNFIGACIGAGYYD